MMKLSFLITAAVFAVLFGSSSCVARLHGGSADNDSGNNTLNSKSSLDYFPSSEQEKEHREYERLLHLMKPGFRIPGSYMVSFSDNPSDDVLLNRLDEISNKLRGKRPQFTFKNVLRGASFRGLDDAQVRMLEETNGLTVIQDGFVTIDHFRRRRPRHDPDDHRSGPGNKPDNGDGNDPPAQQVPWGVSHVNGGITYTGSGTVWVIDTGVDLDHPDLNVDIGRSKSFVPVGWDAANPDDANGHGTHVAGTIAAIDNDFGVVGVAAGAQVVSVRVLNRNGAGAWSWIIAGIDYVAASANPGDVANLSLIGGANQDVDDAVIAAAKKGVMMVLAAGNSNDNAASYSPARTEEENVYTVSAFNWNQNRASFTNYGSAASGGPIDCGAPGVDIRSTYIGGRYATFSGTSMAAPHLAGVLLVTNGAYNIAGFFENGPSQMMDPICVI